MGNTHPEEYPFLLADLPTPPPPPQPKRVGEKNCVH